MVGYQNKGVEGDWLFNFAAPTFERVDKDTMTLKDIKFQYTELDPAGQILWSLDQGGATSQDYYYVNEAVADDWGYLPEEYGEIVGWYSDENCTIPANDVEIPYGQGFAIVSGSADVKAVFAGAVKAKEATVDIIGDWIFNFTGNVIPVDYTLGDLAFIYEELDPAGQILWTLDLGGATKQDYYYVNEAVADDWGYLPEEYGEIVGWYSDENCTIPANDVEMPSGQGFAVVSGLPVQLWVPSPVK